MPSWAGYLYFVAVGVVFFAWALLWRESPLSWILAYIGIGFFIGAGGIWLRRKWSAVRRRQVPPDRRSE